MLYPLSHGRPSKRLSNSHLRLYLFFSVRVADSLRPQRKANYSLSRFARLRALLLAFVRNLLRLSFKQRRRVNPAFQKYVHIISLQRIFEKFGRRVPHSRGIAGEDRIKCMV